jgi:hypothetical protein
MEAIIGAELVVNVDGKPVRKPTAEVLAGKKFVALYCACFAAPSGGGGGGGACARARARWPLVARGPPTRLPARPPAGPPARPLPRSPPLGAVSAHWCGPCRKFTPLLSVCYEDQPDRSEVEVVFVSADHDEEGFNEYLCVRSAARRRACVPRPRARAAATPGPRCRSLRRAAASGPSRPR